MLNVYLLPGFMASNLGILSTGESLWWDSDGLLANGTGKMRLASNGTDPGPPDGVQLGVDPRGQYPWEPIASLLRGQLDPTRWTVAVAPYDWRLDLQHHGQVLAANIRAHSTPDQPATLVGHSAGGLVAVLAWSELVGTGETNLVRRIITIGTPFQGSYSPIDFLAGIAPGCEQLLALRPLAGIFPSPILVSFTLPFLQTLALTWPSFYELFPLLGGTEFAQDPNRILLYSAADYPPPVSPSQVWLDFVRQVYTPRLNGATTFPPAWVATYCYATGIQTRNKLPFDDTPINLVASAYTQDGDGVVTKGSATRRPGVQVQVFGSHESLPLGMAQNGLLATLIVDPRGPPPDPPEDDFTSKAIITMNVTPPGQSDPVTGFQCIGGHC